METGQTGKAFVLDEAFIRLFPHVAMGVLVAGGIRKADQIDEAQAAEIRSFLETANQEARRHLTSEVISENKIPATWRAAYKKFPTKKGPLLHRGAAETGAPRQSCGIHCPYGGHYQWDFP